ncbi:MAG: transglutaminaseTgpA domain-containing protein [Acutalibacteraceae bacterium]
MNKKSVSNRIFDLVLIFLLVPSVLWCVVTSFNLRAEINAVVIASGISLIISSLAFIFIKSAKQALAVCGAVVFVILILFCLEAEALAAQLEYAVNSAFDDFSKYIPVPQSITISTRKAADATVLLSFIGCILSFVFALSILKLRTALPIVIISVLFAAPCFILVDTCPNIVPLFISIAALAALLIASRLHKHGGNYSAAVSAASFAVVFGILCSVLAAVPPESFKREPWQDKLLLDLRQAVGLELKNGETPNNGGSGNTSVDEVDLGNTGEITQTHEVVMQVYTDTPQTLYLRGKAYASYENNRWSSLTDEQYKACPSSGSWNPFFTDSLSGGELDMKVVTKKTEDVIYTPYYLSQKPSGISQSADMYLYNQERKKSYNLSYRTYPIAVYGGAYAGSYLNYDEIYDPTYIEYSSFAYENYTQISDELYDELRFIGRRNGLDEKREMYFDVLSSYYDPEREEYNYSYNEGVAEAVREFVSSRASYSLKPSDIPQGEDIASYLLEDNGMSEAYCVHFATAAAMLLRAYGVPSRYVTGYCVNVTGDEPYTTITTDNAHAWAEYFVDGVGWMPLEATPSGFSPVSANADPIEEETKPTDTQSETQQETIQSAPSAIYITGEPIEGYGGIVLIVIISAVLIPLLAVTIRCVLIKAIRRKRINTGGRNKRAVYVYRYIERCAKYSKQSIPQEIYDIGAKASFSRHKVTESELRLLTEYAQRSRVELYKNGSLIKRIYYAVIAAV